MYVIAIYDVAAERTGKMLKLCRQYLTWIQNSVFEGELSEVHYQELIYEAEQLMDPSYDSFILFSNRVSTWMEKEIVGVEKGPTDQLL